MAIAFNNATASANNSGSATFSHTCTGSDRYLFVYTSQGNNVSAVTYNGVAMTLLTTYSGSGTVIKVWGLAAPSPGSNTVSITASGAWAGGASSYTGVSQSSIPEAFTNATTGSPNITITSSVTTIKDNAWVLGFGHYSDSGSRSLNAGSGATGRVVQASSTFYGATSIFDSNAPKTPAGSYSMTANVSSGSGVLDLVMYSIQPSIPTYGALLMAQMTS